MQDPLSWSIPFGQLFGVKLRIHWLFPFVAIGWILHTALYKPTPEYKIPEGLWIDACILMLILFLSTILHEFGHCFAARLCGGEANEILLWPLGGLAQVELPQRPFAHFMTAAAGPAVNFLLVGFCTVALLVADSSKGPLQPSWNPMPGGWPARGHAVDTNKVGPVDVQLRSWDGTDFTFTPYELPVWLARIAWVNWFLGVLNVILIGFPLDGGRMLQSVLWPSLGHKSATLAAVFSGFGVVFLVGIYALVFKETLALALALFIFVACQRQWVSIEHGSEDTLFGYDFSQGYTSLERDQIHQAAPPRPRVSWWRRWLNSRAARRLQRELEQREAEERRMDELLDKVHRQGRQSLTEEEERFLKRVSDRYKRK